MHKLIKKYFGGAAISPNTLNSALFGGTSGSQNFALTLPITPFYDFSSLNNISSFPTTNSVQNIPSLPTSSVQNVLLSSPSFEPGLTLEQAAAQSAIKTAGPPQRVKTPGDIEAESKLKRKQQRQERLENGFQQIGGVGLQMMGQQLGETLGGDWGDVAGQVLGNLGGIIGSGGSLKDFTSANNFGSLGANIGTGVLNRHTAHDRYSGKRGDIAGGIDLIAGLFDSNPYAAVGMAAINKITGGTDGMTTEDALLGSPGVAGALWAASPIAGAAYMGLSLVNSATGKTTQRFQGNDFMSQEARAALGGSYGKTEGDLDAAAKRGGKKFGGIDRITGQYDRANRIVGEGNERMQALNTIYDRRQLGQIRGQNMADINALDYRLNTFGGYDQYGTRIGRKGMKLPTKDDMTKVREILSFKGGGQMSVIPEGALHARLHHMETENKITRKGIPVIDKHGEQLAEIERNEIIFSLEVTNRLELLRKDGSEKAALEAGKLLVYEIFNNTDDRTGLIDEVINEDEANKPVFKEGGIIAEMPIFSIEAEEPNSEEDDEVEYFQTGGILAEMPDGSDDEEIEEYKKEET